jgi:hypothetical protein
VHDTLRVDDDLHALHTNVKKPACFDHFQGFLAGNGVSAEDIYSAGYGS